MFWGKHLLDSHCQQQHTISLSSAEAELHEVVNGAARGLFIRNVLQAMELKAVVQVGRDSSAAAGITPRVGAVRERHLEVKDLWMQEKIRSHELKISREKSENNRADLLTKFLDPDRHHQLIKLLPLSVPGTRRELANSAVLGCGVSLLQFRVTADRQTDVVERIEVMLAVARWLARGSRGLVVEFVEMTMWILWWAWRMLLVGVASWWLCVTNRQTARRTVAPQTELLDVYVSQYGEIYHRDHKCHGLRNASRVQEKRTCQNCG